MVCFTGGIANQEATLSHLTFAHVSTIRAGNTGMPEEKLVENIVAIAEHAVEKIPRKWANIRSIAIKTPESTSLPFYHKLPEELLEIAKLAGVEPAFKDIPVEAEDKTASEDDSSSKKKKLTGKSPLIRALKKQKRDSSEKDEKGDSEKAAAAKEGKNDKILRENKKRVLDETESKEKKSSNKTVEKKQKKESRSEEDDKKKEMGDFVASKKFKGSKKGYVFRAGKQGVGYYKDVKPVVDKMVLAALSRSFSQGGSKGRKSKSPGKRKGRR